MFANKGSESRPFRIFWLVIILELLNCGDRVVLGRHLHRHSNSRRLHRQSIEPSEAASENIEYNDLPEYEKLGKGGCASFDDSRVQEVPEISYVQPQPEDFVFLDDAHPAPNEMGDNERLAYIEDNELDRNTAAEKVEDENSRKNSITPPCIGSRNIIKAPLKPCAVGERMDRKGECRLILPSNK